MNILLLLDRATTLFKCSKLLWLNFVFFLCLAVNSSC